MSRLGFAQIARLKAHYLHSAEVSGALQSDQQLLNLVELNMVAGQPGDVVCERVALRPDIGYLVLPGQVPNAGRGSTLRLCGHGFSSIRYNISSSENL